MTGIGTPGGDCRRCPFNKFGSGDGQSKLCKNKRMLYILREGELFPVALSLPTGSLKTFTNYVKHQLTKGKKLSQIVTRISLKSPEEITALSGVVETCKAYAANLSPAMIADDDIPFVAPETGEIVEALN